MSANSYRIGTPTRPPSHATGPRVRPAPLLARAPTLPLLLPCAGTGLPTERAYHYVGPDKAGAALNSTAAFMINRAVMDPEAGLVRCGVRGACA